MSNRSYLAALWRLPPWVHVTFRLLTGWHLFRIVLEEEWEGDDRQIKKAVYKWTRIPVSNRD